MNNKQYLHQKIQTVKEAIGLKELPAIIETGLAKRINLRAYQIEALRYFVTYYETGLSDNKQIDTLFHMATGSGKTVIMAALILYLYTKGYRNYVFVVDQNNIIQKTKENFLNVTSNKYLFADELTYLGEKILIREVDKFTELNPEENVINIHFSSTNGLHNNITMPRENLMSIDDFEGTPVVFLADESHHLNRQTLRTPTEKRDAAETDNNWEQTIRGRAFHANINNIMLEFTATVDLNEESIRNKYLDKIVYDYSLKHFRESGFTKEFHNFATSTDIWTRTLIACIMSEFRRYLFADAGQNVKPVIMIQSNTKKESETFYEEFHDNIHKITAEELQKLYSIQNVPELHEALDYFKKKESSLNLLANSLRKSMTKEYSLNINSTTENTPKNHVLLNSLEDKDNSLRLIFTVKMLIEGWDVLNLFDIVRAFDKRQSKKYTLSEAQLIGRGARYFPFQVTEGQERYKRKYDQDIDNPFRYLETMYFHSNNDSRYIAELREALIFTGMVDDKKRKITYILKDSFRESDLFNTGLVFSNERILKDRQEVLGLDASQQFETHRAVLRSHSGLVMTMLEGGIKELPHTKINQKFVQLRFAEIPYNVLVGACERYPALRFSSLRKKYPHLKSLRQFLTGDDYLGNNTLELVYYTEEYTTRDLYNGLIDIFKNIAKAVVNIKPEYQGSEFFKANAISNVIKDKSILLSDSGQGSLFDENNDGIGVSQRDVSDERLRLDLRQEDWYVYEDNYGTSEEKKFIVYFKTYIAPRLDEKGLEYYVIRNERIADLAIYSFENGERFEPDFLLFIKRNRDSGYEVSQVYAEPKGSHLLEYDQWKDNFSIQIESVAKLDDKYTFNNKYRVLGLPLFNEEHRLAEFKTAVDEMISKL